jgi:hypothetical protein
LRKYPDVEGVQKYQTSVSEEKGLRMELIDVGTARATALRQSDAALGLVTENRILTALGAPEKRHLGMYMDKVSYRGCSLMGFA